MRLTPEALEKQLTRLLDVKRKDNKFKKNIFARKEKNK
jgi:hypothetical protein